MSEAVTLERRGGVAVILVDNPPVNAIGRAVRAGLMEAARTIAADGSIGAAVLACRGRTFMAGADIREFDTGIGPPGFHETFDTLEALDKPIVAAIHGTALGGGAEAALACHYRVAAPDAKIGLPEVNLGIVPGAGGTQRLPRLIGVEAALDVILSATPVAADKARSLGIVDAVVTGDLVEGAVAFARALLAEGKGPRRASALTVAPPPDGWFAAKRADVAKKMRGRQAPLSAIDAVEASLTLPFAEGLALEKRLNDAARMGTEARSLRHVFFAEREARRVPGLSDTVQPRPVRAVGIVGAGTMGGGITMCFADAGIPVVLLDATQEGLDRGLGIVRGNYARMVERGKLTAADLDVRLSLIRGELDYAALAHVDLVIEAVFEGMDLKKQVFAALDRVCKPGCVLATNTSSLDVDEIAAATSRPQDVLGLHFFSPANVMPLVEVVRGGKTGDAALATGLDVVKTIKKTAVVSGVCFGFIGNRMLDVYGREAQRLLLEGATPAQVDAALEAFGMAMGPFAVYDLAGVDVGVRIRQERAKRHKGSPGALPDDPTYFLPSSLIVECGWHGQKTGRGFYRYDAGTRARTQNPEAESLIRAKALELGIPQRGIDAREILERCLFALINEGARILEDGIALRASDIDVVYISGYGFPRWRGGPMFHADTVGLPAVLDRILEFRATFDPRYWQPAPLLERLAREGSGFAAWDDSRAGR